MGFARTSVGGFIKASGTTIEHDPTIKSDGVGEVFKWLASTGSSSITIDESASNLLSLSVPSFSPSGVIDASAGSAAAPSIIFNGDVNTGFYQTGADGLGFSTAGTLRLSIDSVGNLESAIAPTPTATTVNETADFAGKVVIANGGSSAAGDRLPLVFNVGGNGADNISAAIVGEREASGWNSALSFWVNSVTSGAEGTDAIQEAMRIDSAGLLTSTQAAAADLPASFTIDQKRPSASGSEGSSVLFKLRPGSAASTVDTARIVAKMTNNADADGRGKLVFQTMGASNAAPTDRLTIDHLGALDIGSSWKFNANGTGTWGETSNFGGFTWDTGQAIIYAQGSNSLVLKPNSADGITISSAGAVSIPSGTLTIGSLDIGHGWGGDVNSTAVGTDALDTSHAGSIHNTAIGHDALTALNAAAGSYNTAVGSGSGAAITSGAQNTAVGYQSLGGTDDGQYNVAMGHQTLLGNCGDHNTGLGYYALNAFTGQYATAIGSLAADAATTAANTTAIGYGALGALTDGTSNTAVGAYALWYNLTTGDYNTAVGNAAGQDTYGDHNTFMGRYAGLYSSTVNHCIAIGSSALQGGASFTDATCDYNNDPTITHDANANIVAGLHVKGTGIPAGATISSITDSTHFELSASTTGGAVTNGTLTFWSNTGDYNIAIGSYAGDAITTGDKNVLAGHQAGTELLAGGNNVLLGYQTGDSLINASSSVAIGSYALSTEDVSAGNVAIGYQALQDQNVDNANNVAVGYQSALNLTSGTDSVYVGYQAGGVGAIDGDYNTVLGAHAAKNATSARTSVFVGQSAGGVGVITGAANVAIGNAAGYDLTAGNNNVLVGTDAGANITTAQNNVAIGSGAWATGVGVASGGAAGQYNVVVGGGAGNDLTDGYSNVLLGHDAGANFTNTQRSVAIGHEAMGAANGAENYNVAIGYQAFGSEASDATYCVAIGYQALLSQNGGVTNTAIGGLAGDAITTGHSNTLIGYAAGSAGTTSDGNPAFNNNVMIGHQAGMLAAEGGQNTFIGAYSGDAVVTGDNNTCVGYGTGTNLLSGPGNVLMGYNAGAAMTDGDYNVAIGFEAADGLVGAANDNIAIGKGALGASTNATTKNIAIGSNALSANVAAASINVAIGYEAGDAITSGTHNTLVGHQAGSTIATNGSMTAVGFNALKLATGSNNTAVGVSSGKEIAAGTGNTSLGANSLYYAGDGSDGTESYNTAIGSAAFYNLDHDDAEGNTAVGESAGRYYNAGSGNTALEHAITSTYIGYLSRAHAGTSATFPENETAIGYNALGIGDNTFALGDTNITAIKGQVDFAAYSDRRIKRDIANDDTGLALIEKLQPVTFKFVNPADYPEDIRDSSYSDWTEEQLVSPAVKAADEVWEDVVVQEACDACAEETREEVHPAVEEVREMRVVQEACDEEWEDIVHPAEEAVYEDRVVVHAEAERTETHIVQHTQEEITEERVTQEACEEIKGERQKFDEKTVSEEVTNVEFVKGEGDAYIRKETTETVERIERTPLYTDHPVVNPDGTPCVTVVSPAVEAKDAVVDEDGNEIEPAVEAVAEVTEPVIHQCPIMEEYIVQEAQEEVRETVVVQEAQEEKTETTTMPAVEEVTERFCIFEAKEEHTERRLVREAQEEVKEEVVVVEAKDEWTETIITRPAEPAREEITERRLVSEAVEAKDAVYETVTVPAIKRPKDNDTVRLGLIAQDVQTALTEAGLEADLVDESPDGRLSLKYGSLVMPLIKAVQELSARVKQLEA